MQAYLGTRISPHIVRTPEGFMICTAPIARSGWQTYRRSEIDGSSNETPVRVYRPVSEVTSNRTLASGEGKPIVSPHPPHFVSPENWSWTGKGHVQNVRVGPRDRDGNVTLVADLHIHDGALIAKIATGTRDLSCGYTYDLDTQPDGTFAMRNIRLNHVAVVEQGRAGTTQIMDARTTMTEAEREEKLERIEERLDTLFAMAGVDPEEPKQPEGEEYDAHGPEAEALTKLRSLRPMFEASGDRKAIDSFNDAVRAVKARLRVSQRRSVAADSRRNTGVDFFDAARQFHRRSMTEGQRAYEEAARKAGGAEFVRDSLPPLDDWFESHREAGRKMREKKW